MTTYSHHIELSIPNIVVGWGIRGNAVDNEEALPVADYTEPFKTYPQVKRPSADGKNFHRKNFSDFLESKTPEPMDRVIDPFERDKSTANPHDFDVDSKCGGLIQTKQTPVTPDRVWAHHAGH